MKTMIFTQRNIAQLKAEPKSYTVMDSKSQGLGVRVSPKGKKVFVAMWRVNGRAHTQTLGLCLVMSITEARQKSIDCLALWQQGHAEIKQSPTFSEFIHSEWKQEVFERWKPSTQRMANSVLARQFLPCFGHRRLHLLTVLDVRHWFEAFSLTKAGGANRALDILQSIIRLAIVHGHIKSNLCAGITQNPKRTLNRFLSMDEISEVDRVMKQFTLQGGERERQCSDILRLLLLTGCRLNEIVKLKWSYIDNHEIHLPDSKTGARSVYLSHAAKDVLSRQDSHTDYVFEQQNGEPQQSVPMYWRKVRVSAHVNDVRIHDLRHTFASHAALMNETLPMISKMLGHKRLSMTLRYTHVSQQETKAAAQRIALLIDAFAQGKDSTLTVSENKSMPLPKTLDKKQSTTRKIKVPLTTQELMKVIEQACHDDVTFDELGLRCFRKQLEQDLSSCSQRELSYRVKAQVSRLPKVKTGTRVETLELCLPIQEYERYKTHVRLCHVTLLSWLRMGLNA